MAQDILFDDNYNLGIEAGDFVIGESNLQNIHFIIKSHPSKWTQFPLLGFGESRLINGVFDGRVKREIQLQLESDGYKATIKLEDNQLKVIPNGTNNSGNI